MSNKFKDIDMKNHTNYFFNVIINMKNFDPNNINHEIIDEMYTKLFLFTTLAI